jgi:hypothetical protein
MQEKLNISLLVNIEEKRSVFSTFVSFSEIYNNDLLEFGSGRLSKILAVGVDKGQAYIKGRNTKCLKDL